MTRNWRSSIGLALALMLALTGQSMAVARGMPEATGQIVLCTGSGPVMVAVDEDGQPVGAPHICPDFALTLFAAVSEGAVAPLRVDGFGGALWPAMVAMAPARTTQAAQARAPPV